MRTIMMCVGVCALAAGGASGAIIGSTGAFDVIPAPPDATQDVLTSTTQIRAWNELQNVTLAAAVDYDAASPGLYDETTDLGNYSLPAGTVVSSHYIHFDSPGGASASANGSITFSGKILAVICTGDNAADLSGKFDQTDYLGAPTLYPDSLAARGMELTPNTDRFFISADGTTLSVRMNIAVPGDFVRVLTEVPAPGPMAAVSLGALGLGLRRRR